jgi:hypothetical protein
MADRYIDIEETLIYGPYATRKIKEVVAGLLPKFDPALDYVVAEISDATAAVERVLGEARETDASRRAATAGKGPILAEARDLLVRFARHLDGHKAGAVDKKRFFPSGSPSQLGNSAPRILLAISHIAKELKGKDAAAISDVKTWQKDFSAVAGSLAPAVAHADSARTARRDQSAELAEARAAWLETYMAGKRLVESVLRLSGKLHLLPTIFHDLAVPDDAKITAPPADPAPQPAPASPGSEPAPAPPKSGKRSTRKSR